ncbi:hypothetical protein M3936_23335 [Sutcliffiella horikoshii]|uniref:hypothetical protein n=1 Tax=Sutcliffiella horikoshii TaxID=79883 RepID=UPI00203B4A92|nr:hypothetical protein [Sutcliffiella horikoshii]MCM3620492.1 hypothetical protein [Sutcliffiella horikoshii]
MGRFNIFTKKNIIILFICILLLISLYLIESRSWKKTQVYYDKVTLQVDMQNKENNKILSLTLNNELKNRKNFLSVSFDDSSYELINDSENLLGQGLKFNNELSHNRTLVYDILSEKTKEYELMFEQHIESTSIPMVYIYTNRGYLYNEDTFIYTKIIE